MSKMLLSEFESIKDNISPGRYPAAQWREFDRLEREARAAYKATGEKLIGFQGDAIERRADELAAEVENIGHAWTVVNTGSRTGALGPLAYQQAVAALIRQREGIPAVIAELRAEVVKLSELDPVAVAEEQYRRLPALRQAAPDLPNLAF